MEGHVRPPRKRAQVRVEVHEALPADQPKQEPAADAAEERGGAERGHEPHEEVKGAPIAHEEGAKNPNAPEPPRDADAVVGVATAAEEVKV
jgi:hypothetical protein